MRTLAPFLLGLLWACAAAPPPAPASGSAASATPAVDEDVARADPAAAAPAEIAVDDCPRAAALTQDAVAAEASCLLQRYVQVDTRNPPGNELASARFLQRVLQRDGIEPQILESAPGRANLIARIPGRAPGKPIVLVHHMDVVPVDEAAWSAPPMSGEVRDGHVWGRGAIDNKGGGVVQLLGALLPHRLRTPLPHDVVLLAVADEEAGGGLGARWLVEQHFDLVKDAALVLNEGGAVLDLGEGRVAYSVEVAQKAPLWLRITARAPSGHGSSPHPGAATHVLARALGRLEAHRFPIEVSPEVQAVFTARAQAMPPAQRTRFENLGASLRDPKFREAFMADPRQAGLVRNTLAITMIEGGDKENVLPASASAVLDLRLLPGQDAAAVTEELVEVMGEQTIEVETLLSWHAHTSPQDTPAFAAIRAFAGRRDPGAPVSANVIGGFTDCNAFRARGLLCYGFTPIRLSPPYLSLIHGEDERMPIDVLGRAVLDMTELLQMP